MAKDFKRIFAGGLPAAKHIKKRRKKW